MNAHFVLRNDKITDNVIANINALRKDPIPHEVEIRPYKGKRSLDQNALYHAILHKLTQHTGYSHDELHNIMKARFLGYDRIQYKDILVEAPRSTTKLTVAEFAQFVEQVMAWASSEFGVVV